MHEFLDEMPTLVFVNVLDHNCEYQFQTRCCIRNEAKKKVRIGHTQVLIINHTVLKVQ